MNVPCEEYLLKMLESGEDEPQKLKKCDILIAKKIDKSHADRVLRDEVCVVKNGFAEPVHLVHLRDEFARANVREILRDAFGRLNFECGKNQ